MEWVTGVCTEAWQGGAGCREVLSAVGQVNKQLDGELKRANNAGRQQRSTWGTPRGRLAGLVGECRGLVLCGGEVVVRPVQRVAEVAQMGELAGLVMSDTVQRGDRACRTDSVCPTGQGVHVRQGIGQSGHVLGHDAGQAV